MAVMVSEDKDELIREKIKMARELRSMLEDEKITVLTFKNLKRRFVLRKYKEVLDRIGPRDYNKNMTKFSEELKTSYDMGEFDGKEFKEYAATYEYFAQMFLIKGSCSDCGKEILKIKSNEEVFSGIIESKAEKSKKRGRHIV